MHQRALDAVDFPELLTRALQQPIDGVRVTKQWERLYSSVWFLDARTARGTLRIVAKHLKSRQEFEKQLRSLQAARDIFVGRSDVCIPYIACSAPEHLLFTDPALKSIINRLNFSFTRFLRDNQNSSSELSQWIKTNSFRVIEVWSGASGTTEPRALPRLSLRRAGAS